MSIIFIFLLFSVVPAVGWLFRLGADVSLDAKREVETKRLRERAAHLREDTARLREGSARLRLETECLRSIDKDEA